jgi:antitoxin MazE
METTLQKWGNSQGVRLPKQMTESLGIQAGAKVELELSADGESLTIRPAKASRAVRGRYRINDLLAASGEDAFAGEIDWGKPEGREAW